MASIHSGPCRRSNQGVIFRLSNKILSQVFIVGKAQALKDASGDPNFLMLRSIRPSADQVFLTRIMEVCRLWREVALDTLELWSAIVLDSPRLSWSTKSFKRSKGAPLRLHIHCDENVEEDSAFWALASTMLSESLRLLEVCIGCTSLFTTSTVTLPLLRLSDRRYAPLLETLRISIPGRYESHDPLSHLLWDNLPSLRILQLIVVKCPPLPPLPSLTHLYLGELGSHPVGCAISPSDLLRVLGSAPNLEVIEIAMPQQEVAVNQPVEQSLHIPLDHLKCISLTFLTDAQIALLRALDFPSSTSVLLASYPTDRRLSNCNVNLLRDIIVRYVDSLNGVRTARISLEIKPCDWDIYSFNITLSTPSNEGDDPGSCSDMIALTLPMPPNWFDDYSSILAAMPLSSTNTLHLSGFAFSTIFSLGSGIKHLELSFFNRGGYVADGAKTVASLLSTSELDFPCPELEVISVNDSSSYPPNSQAADRTAPQDMFSVLVDVVKERALWTPLRLIKLRRCWVEKEVLEELERIITVEQSESLARN